MTSAAKANVFAKSFKWHNQTAQSIVIISSFVLERALLYVPLRVELNGT
jgi:hypothetical protein